MYHSFFRSRGASIALWSWVGRIREAKTFNVYVHVCSLGAKLHLNGKIEYLLNVWIDMTKTQKCCRNKLNLSFVTSLARVSRKYCCMYRQLINRILRNWWNDTYWSFIFRHKLKEFVFWKIAVCIEFKPCSLTSYCRYFLVQNIDPLASNDFAIYLKFHQLKHGCNIVCPLHCSWAYIWLTTFKCSIYIRVF